MLAGGYFRRHSHMRLMMQRLRHPMRVGVMASTTTTSSSSSCGSSSSSSCGSSTSGRILRCSYHSYPDPNEKPRVSTATSTAKKTLNKSAPEFQVDPTFRVETPFPGVPRGSAFKSTDTPRTHATKLPNGLTVASQDTYGLMSSFAFLVNRGSAYEVQEGPDAEVGATHVLELLAYRSTANRSHQDLLMEIEQLGGMVQCVGSRDGLLYCVDVLRENTEAALDILADTILHAQYTPEEVDDCREIVRLQQNEMPADMLSRDAAQMAGYRGSPMGNSHVCPESHIAAMDSSVLRRFKAKHFHGANCFVSGAGIEHDRFVGLIQEKFKALPSAPPPSLVGVGGGALPPSRFVGGMVANERQLREPFIKLAIGFEVCGWKDPMLVPMCVLQQLLGGGSSFSAGGPGKGMYTRLYREMLNQHYWVESAEAFVTIHEDTGMLGIDGACTPEYASAMIKVIVEQLTKLAFFPVSDEELSRAKNMLKSMMMMQLESRLVLCEDIARQYATYGERESPASVCAKIDAVRTEDITAVAQRMLRTPPAVGAVGHDLKNVPPYDAITTFTESVRTEMAKRR